MIVDTSALMSILLGEADGEAFRSLIWKARPALVSAASLVEFQAVLTRRLLGKMDEQGEELMASLRLEVAPVTTAQAHIARMAYRTYGIGSGHPARLNFGDCFAYALSRETGEPLLFKGDDFPLTDVVPVIPPAVRRQ